MDPVCNAETSTDRTESTTEFEDQWKHTLKKTGCNLHRQAKNETIVQYRQHPILN